MEYLSVNSIRVPILEVLPLEKVKGKPKGSILIISYGVKYILNVEDTVICMRLKY